MHIIKSDTVPIDNGIYNWTDPVHSDKWILAAIASHGITDSEKSTKILIAMQRQVELSLHRLRRTLKYILDNEKPPAD